MLQINIENHSHCFFIQEKEGDVYKDLKQKRERYRIKEVDAIETVTQFMDDGHYVDTGFSLDTLVKDERKNKNVYLRHKI